MKPTIEKRIIVALDLTHQSGREHLDGFYQHSDRNDGETSRSGCGGPGLATLLTRIATRCGFKSSIVLAHLFSSHFDMSMSEWRNTHGEI